MMLARMKGDLPVAIGVIRNVKKTSYTQLYEDQMEEQMANGKCTCVDALLNSATKGKNLKPPIKKSGIFASKSQKYETLLHHIDS